MKGGYPTGRTGLVSVFFLLPAHRKLLACSMGMMPSVYRSYSPQKIVVTLVSSALNEPDCARMHSTMHCSLSLTGGRHEVIGFCH